VVKVESLAEPRMDRVWVRVFQAEDGGRVMVTDSDDEVPVGLRGLAGHRQRSGPGGKPPVAIGPQRSMLTRISDLPCRAMAVRYSSQSGCSPAMQR
jgi:hypothetical protein